MYEGSKQLKNKGEIFGAFISYHYCDGSGGDTGGSINGFYK